MTLRQKYSMLIAVIIGAGALCAGVMVYANIRSERAMALESLANTVFRQAFEFSIVSQDYLLFPHERPLVQMRLKLDQTEKLMAGKPMNDPELRQLQLRMDSELQRVGRLLLMLEKLATSRRIASVADGNVEQKRRIGQYSSQISESVVEVAGIAQRMARHAVVQSYKFSRLADIAAYIAFAIFALIVLGGVGVFGKGLLQQLKVMQVGIGRLAASDSHYRFSPEKHDEIGEVMRAFDGMAEALERAASEMEAKNSSLLHEVAERRRAEDEVRALNEGLDAQVRHRTAELEQALREVKQAEKGLKKAVIELHRSNQDLEQFAYVASHDLQEPLRMVSSFTQLLQKRYQGKLDQDADEFIQFAVDGATRMQLLINDLLAFSRVSTRGKPLEPVDLNDTLGAVRASLLTSIAESGALITSDPLPTVTADPSQMLQLLQNLVGNAIKFRGDRAPLVHLSSQETDDEWVVSVRDNGIGIAPEYSERIFVVFQRLHAGGSYRGSGIGLAICKKIVERHGGSIRVESKPGEGADFIFTIRKQEA